MKIFTFLALVSFVSIVNAGEQAPTPADSVLTAPATVAAPTVVAAPASCSQGCCEVSKEVRLAPWQARRLSRQADRQEARDCRDCCKCNDGCCEKKDCRPKAIVSVRSRSNCCCN